MSQVWLSSACSTVMMRVRSLSGSGDSLELASDSAIESSFERLSQRGNQNLPTTAPVESSIRIRALQPLESAFEWTSQYSVPKKGHVRRLLTAIGSSHRQP